MPTLAFKKREYVSDSTVLKTRFTGATGKLTVEDWMPMKTSFTGICRTLSASPEKIIIQLLPKPDYARSVVRLEYKEGAVSINGEQFFYASHPIKIQEKSILCEVPEGDISWFVLSDTALEMNQQVVDQAKKDTQQEWDNVTSL